MDIKTNIWYSMIEVKYKAIYLSFFNSYLRSGSRIIEVIIVVTSSGAVGGWLVWQHIPYLWAVLIGSAQLLKIVKPYVPFLKDQSLLETTQLFYEELHLSYQEQWFERSETNSDAINSSAYFSLQKRELKHLDKIKHLKIPEFNKLTQKTEALWNQYIQTNYQININGKTT